MNDLSFKAASVSAMVEASVDRSMAFIKGMQTVRNVWQSAHITPDDPNFLRTSSGTWTGKYTMPDNSLNQSLPYTPVLVQGPLWFPIIPNQEVTFTGFVDQPYASMEGFCGIKYIDGSIDIASAYNNNGTANNWGTYYVIGSCNGTKQFKARVGANASWSAVVPNPPPGAWTFQLLTYSNYADDTHDINRRLIGNPWRETDRSGDIRLFWTAPYVPAAGTILINVSNVPSGQHNLLSGDIDLTNYTVTPGYHLEVILTEEVDVEYVQMIVPVTNNHFEQLHDFTFNGKLKLRAIEVNDTTYAPGRQLGPAWDQDNSKDATAFFDLRAEYYSIANAIPGFPTHTQPAKLDGTWSFPHTQNSIGRIRLVNINTKRIYSEYTMPSGLARSYNVTAKDAGQSTGSVYYDGFLDTCFLYDQGVALIALVQQGEWTAAQHMIDGLLLIQNADGSFPFACAQSILVNDDTSLLRTGAIAWVIYGLLIADMPQFRGHWTTRPTGACINALNHCVNNYLNTIGLFKGGKDQNGLTPWWSSEHNFDLWWCFDLADRMYGTTPFNWRFYADRIKDGLLTYGWDAADGIFWQGGGHTDDTVNDGAHAMDMMSWGGALLEKWGMYAERDHGFNRAYDKYYVTDNNYHLSGFCTFIEEDGYPPGTVKSPWCEGSFGMSVALRNSDPKRAFGLIATLARGQLADGSYRYTLQRDPIQPIETFPCLIGAAWNVIAHSGQETPNPKVIWT